MSDEEIGVLHRPTMVAGESRIGIALRIPVAAEDRAHTHLHRSECEEPCGEIRHQPTKKIVSAASPSKITPGITMVAKTTIARSFTLPVSAA